MVDRVSSGELANCFNLISKAKPRRGTVHLRANALAANSALGFEAICGCLHNAFEFQRPWLLFET